MNRDKIEIHKSLNETEEQTEQSVDTQSFIWRLRIDKWDWLKWGHSIALVLASSSSLALVVGIIPSHYWLYLVLLFGVFLVLWILGFFVQLALAYTAIHPLTQSRKKYKLNCYEWFAIEDRLVYLLILGFLLAACWIV